MQGTAARPMGSLAGIAPACDRVDWREDAACRGMGLSVFFPEPSGPAQYDQARMVCASCPVREECLDDALASATAWRDDGFRGGLSPRERDRLRGRPLRRKSRSCVRCGEHFPADRVAFYCSDGCRREVHAERMRARRG